MASSNNKSVLFVCLGNICRSPIAEGVFRSLVTKRGEAEQWLIDSAATANYHIGKRPDNRGLACMKSHGITTEHRTRQITGADFSRYHYIFGMDEENIRNIKKVQPKDNNSSVIKLLGEYDPKNIKIIEDPYYGEEKDFETVYEQVMRCCSAFLNEVSSG